MRSFLALLACCLPFSTASAQDTEAALSPTEFEPNSFWVIDYASSQISGYTVGGTLIRTISGIAVFPLGIAFGPDGRLYVSSSGGPHDIISFDNLSDMTYFGGSYLSEPRAMAFGPMGHLYVVDYAANAVVEFDADHNYVRTIAPSGLSAPNAIAVGVDGHLFVASNGTGEIVEIDPERGIVDATNMDLVTDLSIDAQGNLWATRATDGVYSLDDNAFGVSEHYSGSMWSNSVCARPGPDYSKWVLQNDQIQITSDGTTIARSVLTTAGFSNLSGIAFAPASKRVKLKAKMNRVTGSQSNTEFMTIRWSPGSNLLTIEHTANPSDPSDIESWTGGRFSCFFGFGTYTSLAGTQYQFRATQQRTPARQSGSDSIFVTLKGNVGTYGDFLVTKASGTLDIAYPTYLIHGTFK